MRSSRVLVQVAFTAIVACVATSVIAHPKLVSTNPSPGGFASRQQAIALRFSEGLLPISSASLIVAKMPGAAISPTRVDVQVTVSNDDKSLIIKPSHALNPGSYEVQWHAVSVDTHAAQGMLQFNVK